MRDFESGRLMLNDGGRVGGVRVNCICQECWYGGGGNKRTKTNFLAKYHIFYDINNYNIDKKRLTGSDALAKAFVGFFYYIPTCISIYFVIIVLKKCE